MIDLDLRHASPDFKHYTELRLQENKETRLSLINGSLISNSRTAKSGLSARTYINGSWGFASSPVIDKRTLRAVLKEADFNAGYLNRKVKLGKPELPCCRKKAVDVPEAPKKPCSATELVAFMTGLDHLISDSCPKLSSRSLRLYFISMEKKLITSCGSELHSLLPRISLYVDLTMEHKGEPVSLYNVYGGYGFFEQHFTSPEALLPAVEKQYQSLEQKSRGIHPRAGVHTCILDAELGGILAHEAVGHTVESDLVRSGSVAADRWRQPVASPIVSLADFAHTALGRPCPVPVHIDDEGMAARDAMIIENGILSSYLHDKESAMDFNMPPTGNARAFEYSDEPLVRMRNTAILPGKDRISDMIASIDDGYYLIRPGNGQADATGEFMFAVTMGYEIKKGALGRALKDVTVSGVAFDFLKTVDMVSDELSWECGGFCSKKQLMIVGMGGPAVRGLINVGGR
ncbi:MAG: TldD/PmbA family protein [Candidatus Wallbacteria bacterium]|nr:TldD/PmbA family protein [Candidatus Wallbacteria bacterium]